MRLVFWGQKCFSRIWYVVDNCLRENCHERTLIFAALDILLLFEAQLVLYYPFKLKQSPIIYSTIQMFFFLFLISFIEHRSIACNVFIFMLANADSAIFEILLPARTRGSCCCGDNADNIALFPVLLQVLSIPNNR